MGKVRCEREGRVLRLTLADPESGNTLDGAMVGELLAAVRAGAGEAEVLVLRGEGEVFSRGRPRAGHGAAGPEALEAMRRGLQDVVELNLALRRWPGVAVAAVQGGAWGAACGLLVHCDVVLAEEDARFAFPEITYHLPPALVSAYLAKWIAPKAAHYLVLTGQEIPAGLAQAWGLVNEVVPRGRLGERLEELVTFLAGRRPGALRACKEALLASRPLPDEEASRGGVERVLAWLAQDG